ncbi:type III secretion protein [Vibrio hepatarius]|uniref:type III secretion protein n=1 Tax=Vibrio hepatarius TaxID=171383 RepID=UPI001C093D41|nr:type III secretion protein [Vibrio hepatarius]MBU2898910.1 type III secretion protein [Vibrio hepatarius]
MTPFAISATDCDLEKNGEVVPKQRIQSAIRSARNEAKARSRVAGIIRRARIARDKAYKQSEQIIEDAHKKAHQFEETWKQDAQRAVVQESISWLVEKAHIEQNLVDSLKERIRQQIRSVIEKWSGEQDISQFMVKRLSDQIALQSSQEILTLFVSKEHYAVVAQAFDDQLKVQVKPELEGAQAELVSEFLIVRLDLDFQLQTLLDSFSRQSRIISTVNGE